MQDKRNRKTAYLGALLSFALLLSYVESLIPFYFGIPGARLGLPNLAVVLTLYVFGWKEALLLNVIRVLLSGFLFGNLFSIMYALAGALCSFAVMAILKRTHGFSMVGVSLCGGVFHNVGQILVAVFVTRTPGVFYYLPVLMIAGLVTGALTGGVSIEVRKRLEPFL